MKNSNILLLGGGALVLYYLYSQSQAQAQTAQQQQQANAGNQQITQSAINQGGNLLSRLFGGGGGAAQSGGHTSGFPSYNNSFSPSGGTGGYYNDAGGYIITGQGGSTYVNPSNVAYANAMQTVMAAGNPYG